MNRIKVKKRIDKTIISRKLQKNEQINALELNIVNSEEILGLIPIRIISGLMGNKLQFTVKNSIELSKYLSSGIKTKDFLSIVLKIITTIQSCESYGIRMGNLELTPQYIYYDYTQQEIKLLYWPIISLYANLDLRSFFKNLGENFSCPSEEKPYKEGYLAYFDNRMKFDLYHFERNLIAWVGQWKIKDAETANNRPVDSMFDDRTLREYNSVSSARISSPPERQVRLRLIHPGSNQQVEVTKTPFIVGRKQNECDFVIKNNRSVSKKHLIIKSKDGRVFLYDNYSTNHVLVNGVEIPAGSDYEIFSQCTIEIGSEKIILSM